MNLIDVIPTDEYEKIDKFYQSFSLGTGFKPVIPLYDFLEDWNKSNQNLYHMLGDRLIYKIPYSLKKTDKEILDTLTRYLRHDGDFLSDMYREIEKTRYTSYVDDMLRDYLKYNTKEECIIKNATSTEIELNFIDGKKVIKIPKGTKIFKAFTKLFTYLDASKEFMDKLERFRIDISMIFNDNIMKGNLCFSIHPLDFMTMSDNNSNWTSCMSWWEDGCYRVGTVEMMNANNVICCYLESTSGGMSLYPKGDERNTEETKNFWNDKKWRQLVYVNKDILLAGKAYPYQSKGITQSLLQTLVGLLKDNLGYTYKYGPELYKDMNKLDSCFSWEIDRDLDRAERRGGYAPKKIYFDTKAMYNDMVNCHDNIYWCYRNPIKHSKIINISGKSTCVCCGFDLIKIDDDYSDEYNDRYTPVGGKLCCSDCAEDNSCDECGEYVGSENLRIVENPNDYIKNRRKCCEKCISKMHYCSMCGNVVEYHDRKTFYVENDKGLVTKDFDEIEDNFYENGLDSLPSLPKPQMLCLCNNCRIKIHRDGKIEEKQYPPHDRYGYYGGVFIARGSYDEWKDYFFKLESQIQFEKLKKF